MRRWAFGLIMVGLAWASPARAQAPVAVAYTGPPGDLGAAVRDRLARFASERGLGLADLADPAPAPNNAATLLRRGTAAYFEFRYAEAAQLLDQCVSEIATNGGAGLSRRQLADAYLFRALARTEQGRAEEARDDLIRAATLHPAYAIDKARFRPSLVAAFERARAAALAGPRASVSLGLPAGCQVEIDAAESGAAETLSLIPGPHFIRARCPGKRPLVAQPTFVPGEQSYHPALEPLPSDRARALEATTAAKLIWVSLSRERRGAVAIALIDRASRKVKRRWTLALESPGDAGRLEPILASVLDRQLTPAAAPPRVVVRDRPRRWYQRPWLWVAVGAAAASAAILPFALSGDEPSERFDIGLHR